MATATATRRPRLSDEFLKANTRERVLAGTAKTIALRGFCAAKVADITSASRVARNTFYECFGSKEAACHALVEDVFGSGAKDLAARPSLTVLAFEIAALWRDGRKDDARAAVAEAQRVVGAFAKCEIAQAPPQDDPRQQSLPAGRHGLPPDFKRENQSTRLLSGAARAIAEAGYQATTIKDVCDRAAVSRRTFYEHFGSLDKLAGALVASSVSDEAAESLADVPRLYPRSGLGAVAIEVVAERLERGDSPLAVIALPALSRMAERVGS